MDRRGTTDVATAPVGLVLLLDRVADSLLGVSGDRECWGDGWGDPPAAAGPQVGSASAPQAARRAPRLGAVVDLDARRGSARAGAVVVPPRAAPADVADAASDADLRLRRRAAIEQASRRRARRRLRRLGLRVR
ncbi:MAG: hypothetical protein ACTHOD_18790 [Motilibacteraceae bacterium]